MNQATQSAGKKRDKKLVVAALAMFAIAFGVFGGLYYLQRQAQNNASGQNPAPNEQFRQAADLTPQRKAQYVARAMELREKLRPWAMQHKAELSQMLRSPGDQAAYSGVWNVLPANPRLAGIDFRELASEDPLSTVSFTWAASSKASLADAPATLDPKVKESMRGGEKQLARERQIDFSTKRDIVVSSSMTPRMEVNLWASGRVTERTMLPPQQKPEIVRKVRAQGREFSMSDMFTPYREIAPAYDFLS